MKLAFSTNAYTRHSLADALRGIRRAGFAGVEILADVPHAYPPHIDAELTRHVVATLAETGLAVSNVNCNCSFGYWKDAPPEPYFEPSLISPNPEVSGRPHRDDPADAAVRQRRRARPTSASPAAERWAACRRTRRPASLPSRSSRSSTAPTGSASTSASSASRACSLNTPPSCATGSTASTHPRFGANLDVGHSVVIGENRSRRASRCSSGRIWNLHVEDLPGRKHYHTIPGEGTFDWTMLRTALGRSATTAI